MHAAKFLSNRTPKISAAIVEHILLAYGVPKLAEILTQWQAEDTDKHTIRFYNPAKFEEFHINLKNEGII